MYKLLVALVKINQKQIGEKSYMLIRTFASQINAEQGNSQVNIFVLIFGLFADREVRANSSFSGLFSTAQGSKAFVSIQTISMLGSLMSVDVLHEMMSVIVFLKKTQREIQFSPKLESCLEGQNFPFKLSFSEDVRAAEQW